MKDLNCREEIEINRKILKLFSAGKIRHIRIEKASLFIS
jgi:hypothetical protein